jgi:hypothetical protein
MRTVEALVSFASREWSPSPGQVKACSDELAADLINAGYARAVEEVKETTKPETTVEVAKDEDKSGDNINAVPTAKGKRSRAKSKRA